MQRSAIVASVCLVLWLTESIPLYATTILLIAGIAMLVGPLSPREFSLSKVLTWSAQPVMALFFGGFCLSIAGAKFGIDGYIASWLMRMSRGSKPALLAVIMLGTAVMSMWMSNIAAAAMMIATLRPLLARHTHDHSFRTALLLGIAFAADFGGMGTPIGTGPNLIAIGAVAHQQRITFVQWMVVGVPLCLTMLVITYLLLRSLHRVSGRTESSFIETTPLSRRAWLVVVLFTITVSMWLTEPLHGISAGTVAMALAGLLFALRLLETSDLAKLEWETLMLIAGGLTLGELFSASGLARHLATAVNWHALPPVVLLGAFIVACAFLSAIASNTAAAAMLIQIGLTIIPTPAFAVLVALGASMGVPFVISTPPNSMAYGHGGLRTRDLAIPGMILTLLGCAILTFVGPELLARAGIP